MSIRVTSVARATVHTARWRHWCRCPSASSWQKVIQQNIQTTLRRL